MDLRCAYCGAPSARGSAPQVVHDGVIAWVIAITKTAQKLTPVVRAKVRKSIAGKGIRGHP